MKLKEFIINSSLRCGVNKVFGIIAYEIFERELKGDELFSLNNFKNIRERMSLLLPFRPAKEKETVYDHILNIYEYAALNHYLFDDKHAVESNTERMNELLTIDSYTIEENEMMMADWWNP